MDILINSIARLDEGIPFAKSVIGVAQVTKLSMKPGDTLESYKESGMVFDVVKDVVDGKEVAKHDFSGLKTARNYVLYVIDNEGEYAGQPVILENTKDICEVFKLPEDEAATMMENLPTLAMQRQLCIIPYHNPERDEDCIMFAPDFDVEITDDMLAGNIEQAAAKITNMTNNPGSQDYRTQLISHAFIKMFLYTLVETGQKRYNYYNCEVPLIQMANKLSLLTYYTGGELHTPTISDIEQYLEKIKQQIKVQPM